MLKYTLSVLCCLLYLSANASGKGEPFIVMSYNAENLFDIENDSLTMDDDFTPAGNHHWTYTRYQKKLAGISKVIAAVGKWETPALIGLCEVENKKVLNDLVKWSPLHELKYDVIHQDSPDTRGIDVALLFQKDKFTPTHNEFIRIRKFKTRDILYTAGIIPTGDTLHIFVNHWPSRLGGELESEEKRLLVASILRHKIDSINNTTTQPRIIIMGDFNDTPLNKSVNKTLKANNTTDTFVPTELYNLYYATAETTETGTYNIRNSWAVLDQIIISGTLLDESGHFYTSPRQAHIFSEEFLKEYNEQGRFRPFRTYMGMKYTNGISDHFPIYVEFTLKKEKR